MNPICVYLDSVSNLDCAILDPSVGIIGQSWNLSIKVQGFCEQYGFVYDFKELKALAKNLVSSLDHKLYIAHDSRISWTSLDQIALQSEIQSFYKDKPQILDTTKSNIPNLDYIKVSSNINGFDWFYICPLEATLIDKSSLSLSNSSYTDIIKDYLTRLLETIKLPQNIIKVELDLEYDKDIQCSYFCYSHGLAGYEGLCQRPFHGHRSKLKVFDTLSNQRLDKVEQLLVKKFNNFFICSKSQISYQNKDYILLDYSSTRGRYISRLDPSKMLVLDKISSIENFLLYLLNYTESEFNLKNIGISLSEGIGKGVYSKR